MSEPIEADWHVLLRSQRVAHSNQYQTFIIQALVHALAPLLAGLDEGRRGRNEMQTSVHEHGHSAAVFLVIGAIVEGSIQRWRLDRGLQSDGKPAIDFLKKAVADCVDEDDLSVLADLDEIVVVRDAVAHSHVWEGAADTSEMAWVDMPVFRADDFGRRFRKVTQGATTTRRLQLHVIPSQLGRDDVAKALRVVDDLWRLLERVEGGNRFGNFSRFVLVSFRGKFLRVREIAELLPTDPAEQLS